MATTYLPSASGQISGSGYYLRLKVDTTTSGSNTTIKVTPQAMVTADALTGEFYAGASSAMTFGDKTYNFVQNSDGFNFPSKNTWVSMTPDRGSAWQVTVSGLQTVSISVSYLRIQKGSSYAVWQNVGGSISIGPAEHTLTIDRAEGSSITVNRASSPNAGAATGNLNSGAKVYDGDVLRITFGSSAGYDLRTHTVNGSSFVSGSTHTVSGNVTVKTTTGFHAYTLTLNAGTGSTIRVVRTESPNAGAATGQILNGGSIYLGDRLAITFGVTGQAYALGAHTVNGETFASGGTYTVGTSNVYVAATAAKKEYSLTVRSGTGCSITVLKNGVQLPDGAVVDYDDVLTISAQANEGYVLQSLLVNDAAFTSGSTWTVYGPVEVTASAIVAGAYIKDSNGFSLYTVNIFDGTSWGQYVPYIYTGDAWEVY